VGATRSKIAEQEWRESWEPTLPLLAPSELATRPGYQNYGWAQAERHLKYLARLVGWAANTRVKGTAACGDDELRAAIGMVEKLVRRAAGTVRPVAHRRVSGSAEDLNGASE